jgi:uncharacterized protein (TIGR04255 family)
MEDQKSYKKNFLTSVIIRSDFPSINKEIENKFHTDLKKIVIKKFPIAESHPGFSQEFKISPENFVQEKTEFIEWKFHNIARSKTITFIPKAIFIEYHVYKNFDDLRTDFLEILKIYLSIYKDFSISRLGLRYVNEINLENQQEPFSWEKYINKKMLGMLGFSKGNKNLLRFFNNYEMTFEDFNIRYQYGIYNSDYPAPIKKRNFVLDLDAYYMGPQNYEDIELSLDKYHDQIQDFFERSITDELRRVLNE